MLYLRISSNLMGIVILCYVLLFLGQKRLCNEDFVARPLAPSNDTLKQRTMLQAILLRATSNVRFRGENDWWFEICDSVIVIVIYIHIYIYTCVYYPTCDGP